MNETLLVACPGCHRQYDVSGMEVGEKVRCTCGRMLVVPTPRVREARPLHCSACGGNIKESAGTCGYCGSEIGLAARNLGPACPECFARTNAGAKFCGTCGVAIKPEILQATRADAKCPRCSGALVR